MRNQIIIEYIIQIIVNTPLIFISTYYFGTSFIFPIIEVNKALILSTLILSLDLILWYYIQKKSNFIGIFSHKITRENIFDRMIYPILFNSIKLLIL